MITDTTLADLTLTVLNADPDTILPSTYPASCAEYVPFVGMGPSYAANCIPVDMNNIYNQFVVQSEYQYHL